MIAKLLSLLMGDAASKVAGGAINVVSLAALAPVALWFLDHKDEAFVALTYGQVTIVGAAFAFVLKLAHYTRPPGGPP